jgi:two-component sensor histidine kinase
VKIEHRPVAISLDSIIPLGLAVNEIVTNSLKHAFPDEQKGCISLKLSQDASGMIEVMIVDDGIGLPNSTDIHTARSFGMQIIANLVKKQLHGSMEIQGGDGTVYRIRFKESTRPKRI